MKDLAALRRELDAVDAELVRLFEQRMRLSGDIARCKQALGIPVLDPGRERLVLDSRAAMLDDPRYAPAVRDLWQTLMRLSREEQARLLEDPADPL